MYSSGSFKPQVRECDIEDDGEQFTFWVREPSGREILAAAGKRKEKPAIENAKEMYSQYIVHADGSAIVPEEVEELLNMRLSVVHKISQKIQEVIGLKEMLAEPAKKD